VSFNNGGAPVVPSRLVSLFTATSWSRVTWNMEAMEASESPAEAVYIWQGFWLPGAGQAHFLRTAGEESVTARQGGEGMKG
jgi:hypothetical protein